MLFRLVIVFFLFSSATAAKKEEEEEEETVFEPSELGTFESNWDASEIYASWNEENIDWWMGTWNEAVENAALTRRPIMVVATKRFCTACAEVRRVISESAEVEALSEGFVMAWYWSDVRKEEVKLLSTMFDPRKLSPDGDYTPRIMFFDYKGGFLTKVTQEKYGTAYK